MLIMMVFSENGNITAAAGPHSFLSRYLMPGGIVSFVADQRIKEIFHFYVNDIPFLCVLFLGINTVRKMLCACVDGWMDGWMDLRT